MSVFEELEEAGRLRAPSGSNRRGGSYMLDRANEVPIHDVLRDVFGAFVPDGGTSMKVYCPFAFEHGDGGVDKNCRIYPATNSLFCFTMHGFMPPTRLIQIREDVNIWRAAESLLQRYNIPTGRSYQDRFQDLVLSRETSRADVPTTAVIVESLHRALRNVEEYLSRQFDPDVTAAMEEELDRADALLSASADMDEIRHWHTSALHRITSIILST